MDGSHKADRLMFSYVAYGMRIQSPLALPGLLPAAPADDVVIRIGAAQQLPADGAGEWSYSIAPGVATLARQHVGAFEVRGGREVLVTPTPNADPQVIALYLTGPILAVLLCQRGTLVLHGSSVRVEGGAVAFLGQSGDGKSSLAAAMHARGHAILADDITAVDVDGESVVARPGFPQLKVSPDVAALLRIPAAAQMELHPLIDERAYHDPLGFSHVPVPLRALVVVAEDACEQLEPLRPQAALIELVRYSYAIRTAHRTYGEAMHMRQCAVIARTTPVYRLRRPRVLLQLPDVARRLEERLCPPIEGDAAVGVMALAVGGAL